MQAEKLLEISNEIESKETETSQRQQACYQPPIYSERFDNNFEGPLAGMQLCSLTSIVCICLDDSRLKQTFRKENTFPVGFGSQNYY